MRFQSVIIVVAVLAASLVIADDNLDESKTVEKIELLGGKATRDDTLPGHPVIGVNLRGSQHFNNKYVYLLSSFMSLKSLNLERNTITDDAVQQISKLKQLMDIWINGTQITNEGIKDLRKSLPNMKVHKDDSLEFQATLEIKRFGGVVTRDNIRGTPVIGVEINGRKKFNDENLHVLKVCLSLKTLDLQNAEITDDGLRMLA